MSVKPENIRFCKTTFRDSQALMQTRGRTDMPKVILNFCKFSLRTRLQMMWSKTRAYAFYWSVLHTSNVITHESINWHILQFLPGQTAWLQHDMQRLHIHQMLL